MSKLLLIVEKNRNTVISRINDRITQVTARIIPDIIQPNKTSIIQSTGLAYYTFNPVKSNYFHEQSVCLGYMVPGEKEWWIPGSKTPDGTFALFRANDEVVEVLSDYLASRSIWYYCDDEVFMASTSQRALIMGLQSFRFNEKVIPWMLFSGITGPEYSWDDRIKLLPADSVLKLNRKTWQTSLSTQPKKFAPERQSFRQSTEHLNNILSGLLTHDEIDCSKWVLPLSGGYDSRGLLYYLKDKPGLQTVTWGLESSRLAKDNDAFLASAISQHFGVPNTYFSTDRSDESFDILFHRFLLAGEGRLEHIGGYMDGFKIWATLFNRQYAGSIRGDQALRWTKVYVEDQIYPTLGINTINSFRNLEAMKSFDLPDQKMPEYFKRAPGESLAVMRDRLYSSFRIPCYLAALNDIKLPFIEVYSPLMTARVNNFVYTLPYNFRTGKKLLKNLITDLTPDVPFATHEAILTHHRVVQEVETAHFLKEEVGSMRYSSVLPTKVLEFIASRIQLDPEKLKKKSNYIITYQQIRDSLPKWTKTIIKKGMPKRDIDFNLMAFRSLIIQRMNMLLNEDAKVLHNR